MSPRGPKPGAHDGRNAEIRTKFEALRVELAGDTPSRRVDTAARREAIDNLALDYGLSAERIWQIVTRRAR